MPVDDRFICGVASLAVGVLALTACSPTAPPGPELPPDRANEVLALVQLPPELGLAASMVARECMTAKGHAVPYDATMSGREYNVVAGIVGVHTNREAAARSGYDATFDDATIGGIEGFIDRLPESQRARADQDYWGPRINSVSVDDVWGQGFGIPASGCFAEGQKGVYGKLEDAVRVRNLPNAVRMMAGSDTTERDRALKAVQPAYEKCMKAAGYPVRGLNAEELAKKEFGQYRKPGQPPSGDEQRMITSDFDCQAQAQVRDKLVEAWGRNAAAWVLAHEAEIVGMQELVKASTARAEKIIAG